MDIERELPPRAQAALSTLVQELEAKGIAPDVAYRPDGYVVVVWRDTHYDVAATIGDNEQILRFSVFRKESDAT